MTKEEYEKSVKETMIRDMLCMYQNEKLGYTPAWISMLVDRLYNEGWRKTNERP